MAADEAPTSAQADKFRVSVETTGERPRVVLGGEVDVYTSPILQETLVGVLGPESESKAKTLEIDLAQLDFIDSTGLGVLVGALKRARAADGDVILLNPKPSILKVFEITGLTSLFTIEG